MLSTTILIGDFNRIISTGSVEPNGICKALQGNVRQYIEYNLGKTVSEFQCERKCSFLQLIFKNAD